MMVSILLNNNDHALNMSRCKTTYCVLLREYYLHIWNCFTKSFEFCAVALYNGYVDVNACVDFFWLMLMMFLELMLMLRQLFYIDLKILNYIRESSFYMSKESHVFVGPCEGPTMKCVCPPPTHDTQLRDRKLHFRQSQALKPIHFLKAHVKSYSKTAT